MSYERRDIHGAAVASTLSTDVDASATSFTIADSSGWPDGSNGKFLIAIGRGTASEEKLLVQTRSGTTLTLASQDDRGADDSTAQAHSAGDAVEHVTGRVDADEANYAVNQTVGTVTTKGDLLVATGSNAFGRQAVGANNTVLIADNAQTNGVRYGQVTADEIAAAVAGSGLAGANGAALSVNVDNSTIEISSDSLRVKDGGITNAKLAAALLASVVIPTGAIIPYAGIAAPTNWLLCDGSAVSRTTYAALFTAIGTSFGTGDGTTTFNVPDLRGRVPVGLDNLGGSDAGRLSVANTLGGSGGEQTHTLTTNEMPAHNHAQQELFANNLGTGTPSPVDSIAAGGASGRFGANSDLNKATVGGGAAHNNMQPYLLIGYLIHI